MEIGAVFSVETLIERDIVVSRNDNLGLEVRLLQPLYGLGELLIPSDHEPSIHT